MTTPSINIVATRLLEMTNKRKAAESGIALHDYEFLNIGYIFDDKIWETINSQPLTPKVFTSKHAVKAYHLFANPHSNQTCFCIEGETSLQAREAGFEVLGTAVNAAKLANVIVKMKLEKVMILSGNNRRDELTAILYFNQYLFEEYTVYSKSAVEIPIRAEYDGIAFFSPSQVKAFMKANDLKKDQPVFSIGETTAEFLRNQGCSDITVAETASESSLIDTIIKFYKHK